MKISKFEDLEIWKLSIEIVLNIYSLSSNNKFIKDFGLKDQIRRAVISISSNIAEGFEMSNNNDFVRYLKIAKGSTGEVRSQLYIALKLNYIDNVQFKEIDVMLSLLSSKIGKLIEYLLSKKKQNEFVTR
jgi:four helix bundle protein